MSFGNVFAEQGPFGSTINQDRGRRQNGWRPPHDNCYHFKGMLAEFQVYSQTGQIEFNNVTYYEECHCAYSESGARFDAGPTSVFGAGNCEGGYWKNPWLMSMTKKLCTQSLDVTKNCCMGPVRYPYGPGTGGPPRAPGECGGILIDSEVENIVMAFTGNPDDLANIQIHLDQALI